ncbi:translesion error-prone DNA polymerase V autoproteolytic subunit (plasmid) [Spirosoma taeanense]|uniref:Translesion error-prone DNA polymerase V autoproteolytic subunit n=1 Tax=Spirosoma taeanense TaxID=2735870 RepID=A0A6M5YEN1_9BACT|nr:translesion error-prone DNA polymerase V autoproteolytic subunit [Spirosoma taeanense]QJW92475.1 translesion error-prone DNA polymerase V autoproteolytic subunit [Spirosoma taeanense]
MLDPHDRILPEHIVKATASTRYLIPFFSYYVQAGFPSPAENYIERVCDLNDLCISNAEATYFVQVASDSMIGDRIDRGDVLVVDCSREAIDHKIVVAWLNGDLCVKRIHYVNKMIVLLSSNQKYDPIYVHEGDEFRLLGVVTFVIQRLR